MRKGRRRWTLPGCAAALVLLLGACNQPETGLVPLEQPTGLQAAAPRISGPIPTNRIEQRAFEDRRSPVVPASARGASPPPPGVATSQSGDVTLNFVDTDIREIVRAVLGTTLKVAYTIDPAVHGTGSIETPTPLPRSALIETLETLLNENGAALVVRNGIYNVVPVPAGAIGNLAAGANAIGAGAEVVPLRYAAARDLPKSSSRMSDRAAKLRQIQPPTLCWSVATPRFARLWSDSFAHSISISCPVDLTRCSRSAMATRPSSPGSWKR